MTSQNRSDSRYHGFSILLHWVLGAALVAVFALGAYMADLPFSPQRLKFYSWHKWAGVCILVLSLLRLVWRLTHRPPALLAEVERAMPAWQLLAHKVTHLGLYLLFFTVPLVGWAYSSAAGFPVVLFGLLPLPDLVPVDKALAHTLKEAHELAANAMLGLVLLHVAGALKHALIDRDGLLRRMSPFGK